MIKRGLSYIETMSVCRAMPGTHISEAFKIAHQANFEYLWFNSVLYRVDTEEAVTGPRKK